LNLIGDFKFTPFEQGEGNKHFHLQKLTRLPSALKESVDWFIKNYDNARTGNVKA
jgi:hypothetical protein